MKKKKILFLSVVKIFPPSAGGMIRPATFCKALAELGYDVEIYSFTASNFLLDSLFCKFIS